MTNFLNSFFTIIKDFVSLLFGMQYPFTTPAGGSPSVGSILLVSILLWVIATLWPRK